MSVPEIAVPRTVSVVGEGRAAVTPDVATLVIGVETTNSALSNAQRENAERSTALRARLLKLGLREGDVQTSGYHVGQEHGREGPVGYRVSNTVRVTVREIARVGALLAAAIAAGANQIQQVLFGVLDKGDALHQAREAAMRDARLKAEHYAALVGTRRGAAPTIAESGANRALPMSEVMRRPMSATTPIEPGEGAVTVRIAVTYALLGD